MKLNVNIEDSRNTYIYDFEPGTVFLWKTKLYLKIEPDENECHNAVSLIRYNPAWFDKTELGTRVSKANLNIEV